MRDSLAAYPRVFEITCPNCKYCENGARKQSSLIISQQHLLVLRSYLKPLFTARGITRGVQLENNQPIQAAEKSPLAAKEAAHMEQSIAELPAAAKEQPTRKGLLGRVFGRKRSQRVK